MTSSTKDLIFAMSEKRNITHFDTHWRSLLLFTVFTICNVDERLHVSDFLSGIETSLIN